MVIVKSRKSAKRRVYSKALHLCVYLRDLSAPQNFLDIITLLLGLKSYAHISYFRIKGVCSTSLI